MQQTHSAPLENQDAKCFPSLGVTKGWEIWEKGGWHQFPNFSSITALLSS